MSPATITSAPAQAQGKSSDAAPALVVPFTRAAQEHIESFLDVTTPQLGASSIPISPVDIPAYGFMRGIFIEVTATGGTGAAALYKGDSPFSVLDDISIMDVNGAPIVGPISGFDLATINKYGGYRRVTEAKLHPDYKKPTDGNFSFLLYVPIEVNLRDALGCLANQNAASSYKLRLTTAPKSAVYSADPDTLPTLRIRAWLDAYTQPTSTDLRGNMNATQPPAHGTTSYWSKTTFPVTVGQNNFKLPRVGNYIRDLIFIYRDANGVRNKASFAAPADLYWDTRLLKSFQPIIWRAQMAQRFGLTAGPDDTAGGLDTGVYVEDYMHEFDGLAGAELRDGWLPTVQSTRLELLGNFAAAGTLTVLTNDVSPAGEVFV